MRETKERVYILHLMKQETFRNDHGAEKPPLPALIHRKRNENNENNEINAQLQPIGYNLGGDGLIDGLMD